MPPQGAAEIVLRCCTSVVMPDGSVAPLTEQHREELAQFVTRMASQGLRTLCLSYRDLDPGSAEAQPPSKADEARSRPADAQLTACCIVGIKVSMKAAKID